ncbi:hypothetical protein pEaSNUABM11_00121 [Erwinia phage pEa_SNUABM_11]|nr:hypothetical protein pEaSNUABM11_00121 [Erwinia phage pEa_SNUABM_11]
MILDSIILIANKYINKNGKLPPSVGVHRGIYKRLYHISTVVGIACKVSGMKRPPSTRDFNRVKGILHKAVCVLHHKRHKSPYRGLTKTPQEIPMTREGIVDLRPSTCNVAGLARQRLVAIIDDTKATTTAQEANAAIALMTEAELVLVETDIQSYRLQHYLAERGILTMVMTTAEIPGLDMPNTEGEWSDPTVDHQ